MTAGRIGLAILLVLVAGWVVFLRPVSLGGSVMYIVIRGDSMEPAYQSGDLTNAKQSLDLASQLIGQKNAESFAALLPSERTMSPCRRGNVCQNCGWLGDWGMPTRSWRPASTPG